MKLGAESVTGRFYRLGYDSYFGNRRPWATPSLVLLQIAACCRRRLRALTAEVTRDAIEWGCALPPSSAGNSEIGAFPPGPGSRIPILIMATHKIALTSRDYSLPRSGTKPSLDDKLDRVFQMAEHMDARCVYMLDAAAHRRRHSLAAR